jgi:glycosyltransferase involved in cell wall biosynthesis
MRRIVFFSNGNIKLGSARIRVLKFVEALQKLGHEATFTWDMSTIRKEDIVIMPKIFPVHILISLRNLCKTLIWDVCDNYFIGERLPWSLKCLELCDGIICCTENVKILMREKDQNKRIDIIEDPVYYDFKKPSFNIQDNQLKLAWYGTHVNLEHIDWDKLLLTPIQQNKADLPRVYLKIVTDLSLLKKDVARQIDGYNKLDGRLSFANFSVEIQEKVCEMSDIIILPIDHEKEQTKTKSHNKLVDGIACGKMVLCSPQDSYLKFSDYAYVGNDFVNNIKKCIDSPDETLKRIERGQEYISKNFTADIITKKLLEVLQRY